MSVKVSVEGFQSIASTSIEVEGFTALTGPNNSGKSALMRAIRGVFQNTSGTHFIRHGVDESRVSVEFPDASLTWVKGRKRQTKPSYKINGGGPIYPGREVPDEVRALKVSPIEVGGVEVWPTLAPQFTGQVFLLDKPGSHLAEAVADIDRVKKLNSALKLCESERRSAAAKLKLRQQDIDGVEERLNAYEGLDRVLEKVEEVLALKTAYEKAKVHYQQVSVLADSLQKARQNVQSLLPVASIVVPASPRELLKQWLGVKTLSERYMTTSTKLKSLCGVSSLSVPDSARLAKYLETTEGVRAMAYRIESAKDSVSKFEGLKEIPSLSAPPAKLLSALIDVRAKGHKLKVLRGELSAAKEMIHLTKEEKSKVVFSLSQFKECPACGSLQDDCQSALEE